MLLLKLIRIGEAMITQPKPLNRLQQRGGKNKIVDEGIIFLYYPLQQKGKYMNEQFKIYDKQEPTYDEAKEFIGGYIQSVPLENGDRLLCDEERKVERTSIQSTCTKTLGRELGRGY
jgi:hypothetical protein